MFFNFNVDVDFEYLFSKSLIYSKYFSIYYWNIIFPFMITVFIISLYFEYSKRKNILYNIQNDVFIFKSVINDSIKEIKADISKLHKQIEVDAKFNTHQLNIIENKISKNSNDKVQTMQIIENNIVETQKITHSVIQSVEECFGKFDGDIKLLKNMNIEKDKVIDSMKLNFENCFNNLDEEIKSLKEEDVIKDDKLDLLNIHFENCFNNINEEIETLKETSSIKDSMMESLNMNFEKININFNKIEKQCSGHVLDTEINTQKIHLIEETIKELIYRTNVLANLHNGFDCNEAIKSFRYYRNAYKTPLLDSSYDYIRKGIKKASDIDFNMGELSDPYNAIF
jgi:hypothetical protein